MTGIRCCVLVLTLCVVQSAVLEQAVADPGFEDESTFRFHTSELVPREAIKGPNYQLDPETSLLDGRFVFRIRTTWGVLVAHGKPMLVLRLREMDTIERARKMNREPQLIGSFLNTLVDSRKGAELLLTDPVGSVLRVPAGIGKGLNELLSPANRKSGGEVRRRIAAQLDCDPETTNPILSALLDWIAVRQGVGGVAGKVGLHLVLPGLALIPTTAQFKEQLADESPAELNIRIERELVEMGFDSKLSRRFVRESGLTTLQRMMVVEQLKSLRGVSGHNLLLRRGVTIEKTADAMNFLHELLLLNQIHTRQQVVDVVDLKYPLVTVENGQQLVVCTAGYLVDDQPLHKFTTSCRAVLKQPAAELHGSVRLSDKARATLDGIGVRRSPTPESN